MCFVLQMKCVPLLNRCRPKPNKSKLSNIRKEYKKLLSWQKSFLRYGGHKICKFELFCW
ncbi:hypothetical protein O3M35_006583 [Rhynocoris fuscipes]|uniref:Uncharacterized protein n=1 Tax=Rhynocoris fuscipes TaxID=488301 RepID=A0AAW1DGR2_9HEMI